jgi:hypothetical protein
MGTWLIKFDATGATEQALSYNLNSDRLSKTVASQSTLNCGYQSRTHQLTLVGNASRSLDAAGNTTAMLISNGTQVQLVYGWLIDEGRSVGPRLP